jgi:hypothetical protein
MSMDNCLFLDKAKHTKKERERERERERENSMGKSEATIAPIRPIHGIFRKGFSERKRVVPCWKHSVALLIVHVPFLVSLSSGITESESTSRLHIAEFLGWRFLSLASGASR